MKENRACVAEIDGILENHRDAVQAIKDSIVDRQELIEYFSLNSDDPEVLEKGLSAMWQRVGMLQNAAISAGQSGNTKDKFEYEVEISVLRELRFETLDKLSALKSSG